ncbi:hypothetical protein ACFOD4_04090 [Pseudoroseomonas globiformis]|uniref:Uncharacterized protein n=1 Tax=Teichococcus globiformis TaxID=2307229 RepID=A0ABV7FXT0_9PROT
MTDQAPLSPKPAPVDPPHVDPGVLDLLRETIRTGLAQGCTIREAAAEARGLARGMALAQDRRAIADAVDGLLREIDALLPDLASVELDGRDWRVADDTEVASVLGYAMRFDRRGRARKGGAELWSTIAAGELAARLRMSNMLVIQRPARPRPGPAQPWLDLGPPLPTRHGVLR